VPAADKSPIGTTVVVVVATVDVGSDPGEVVPVAELRGRYAEGPLEVAG